MSKYTLAASTFTTVVLALFALSGCGAAAPATGSDRPTAQAASAVVATQNPPVTAVPAGAVAPTEPAGSFDKPKGKLSSLLSQLADPAVSGKDAQAQNEALGVPADGAGSLTRNEQGAVLVAIRMSSITDADQQILRDLGATIVHVSDSYSTITCYIVPNRLNEVAALSTVENVREELHS